jgi:hypothetical protein
MIRWTVRIQMIIDKEIYGSSDILIVKYSGFFILKK